MPDTETLEKLNTFLSHGNYANKLLHDDDERRWNEFVITAHRQNFDISDQLLDEKLASAIRPKETQELRVHEYRWGRALLSQFEEAL